MLRNQVSSFFIVRDMKVKRVNCESDVELDNYG